MDLWRIQKGLVKKKNIYVYRFTRCYTLFLCNKITTKKQLHVVNADT